MSIYYVTDTYIIVYVWVIIHNIVHNICTTDFFSATKPPVISYYQHSSASQSSAVPMEEGEGEKPTDGEGVESLTDSGNEERAKLSKVMSTEDEVARLTIEVRCAIV
jgi:hypothetical protein